MTARLVTALLSVTFLAAGQEARDLYGGWKVTTVVNAGPVTAMSGEAAARLVGTLLALGPQKLQFARQICRPKYDISEETAADFLQDYKVDAKALRLREPIARFDADCSDIFIRDSNTILFTWKGYFLEAKRAARGK